MITPVRGRLYRADVGFGKKPWLVVSNNARNSALEECLVVRITTTSKHQELPSRVALGQNDPLQGFVVCDDLGPMYLDQIEEDLGALSLNTMVQVGAALRHVLAI